MNLMKVNKRKCKVLPPGRNFPVHQDRLRAYRLESSLAEEDLKVLVGSMLNISQLCSKEVTGLSHHTDLDLFTQDQTLLHPFCVSPVFFSTCASSYIYCFISSHSVTPPPTSWTFFLHPYQSPSLVAVSW